MVRTSKQQLFQFLSTATDSIEFRPDPELDFVGAIIQNWTLGGISAFSCKNFLTTIVCYRKYCRLGGNGPPGSAPDSIE